MPFDPDEYLAKKSTPQQAAAFDPDVYLASKAAPQQAAQEEPGLISKGLRALESVTAAPGRAAVGALQKEPTDIIGAAKAFGHQFGAAPEEAPTGKELVRRAVPELSDVPLSERYPGAFTEDKSFWRLKPAKGGLLDVSPLGVAGGIVGMGADPFSYAGLAGKGIAGLGRGIAKAGRALTPGGLAGAAEEGALELGRAHLRPTAQTARALGPERMNEIVQTAIDTGAIRPGAKIASTAERLGDLEQEIGRLKGDIVRESSGKVNPRAPYERLQKEVVEPLQQTAETAPIAETMVGKGKGFLEKYAPETATEGVEAAKPIAANRIEAEKMAVQDSINYMTDPKAKSKAMKAWATILKEETEKGVEAAGTKGFKESKAAYGNIAAGKKMAERTAGLSPGGGLLHHISDVGAGVAAVGAAATHNPILATTIILGRLAVKGRIASTGAVTLDRIAKALNKSPDVLKALDIPFDTAIDILSMPESQRVMQGAYMGGQQLNQPGRK